MPEVASQLPQYSLRWRWKVVFEKCHLRLVHYASNVLTGWIDRRPINRLSFEFFISNIYQILKLYCPIFESHVSGVQY